MNIEVEIKIAIDNFEEIKAKVAAGGKLVKSIQQIDEYYVPAHKDFFAQKPVPTEWLRIRTNPDKVIFEYDRSIGMKPDGDGYNYDYAEEYETAVSSPEELKKILGFLDFKKIIIVEKQREYWDYGDLEIVLDKIKGLGTFIEVEAKGNFKDSTEAKQACFRFLHTLGIKDAEKIEIKSGYPMMLMEKMVANKKYLGKKVYVKIDRPLNSKHPKHRFLYELNYGFIPGTLSPDGEELDAYVIGVDKSIADFYGTCIAIIHRENDNDDKLVVVSKERLDISDEDIRGLTNFQEKFFKSEILRIP